MVSSKRQQGVSDQDLKVKDAPDLGSYGVWCIVCGKDPSLSTWLRETGKGWQVSGVSVVESSRLVQGLTTPARVMPEKPGIPSAVEASRPQLA